MRWIATCWIIIMLCAGCKERRTADEAQYQSTVAADTAKKADSNVVYSDTTGAYSEINTKGVNPDALVNFSLSLLGTQYAYGCSDPEKGFDCSGFIYYVFNHFGIQVPRSSVEFTDAGKEIAVKTSKPGDLILFTGTDSSIRTVGHMGIVTYNNTDSLAFIHSTSGKEYAVTITHLNKYYKGRFVKVVRIFPQNDT
jgi:cell wall-associated NlpC family hydrolase